MLHDEPKLPLLVRWLILAFGCIFFVTFPQLPDELIIVAIVFELPLPDFAASVPSESITKYLKNQKIIFISYNINIFFKL